MSVISWIGGLFIGQGQEVTYLPPFCADLAQIQTESLFLISPNDPPENGYLNVKKNAQNLTFLQKITKIVFFSKSNFHWQFFLSEVFGIFDI